MTCTAECRKSAGRRRIRKALGPVLHNLGNDPDTATRARKAYRDRLHSVQTAGSASSAKSPLRSLRAPLSLRLGTGHGRLSRKKKPCFDFQDAERSSIRGRGVCLARFRGRKAALFFCACDMICVCCLTLAQVAVSFTLVNVLHYATTTYVEENALARVPSACPSCFLFPAFCLQFRRTALALRFAGEGKR